MVHNEKKVAEGCRLSKNCLVDAFRGSGDNQQKRETYKEVEKPSYQCQHVIQFEFFYQSFSQISSTIVTILFGYYRATTKKCYNDLEHVSIHFDFSENLSVPLKFKPQSLHWSHYCTNMSRIPIPSTTRCRGAITLQYILQQQTT